MPFRIPWGTFPKISTHASLADLAAHPAFTQARAGDFDAARHVVRDLYRRTQYISPPDFIVPVLAKDDAGHWNALPLALAEAIAADCGAEIVNEVVRLDAYAPADAAVNRLFDQADFVGSVEKGTYYIVDDVANFGSTLANLRGYLGTNGGTVVAASVLAAGIFSTTLAPDPAIITQLRRRYASEAAIIEDAFTYPLEFLTNREAYYLFGLQNLDSFRDPRAAVTRSSEPRPPSGGPGRAII